MLLKYVYFLLAIVISILYFSFAGEAQTDSTSLKITGQKSYTFNLNYGWIYAHSIDIKNTAGAKPRGVSFEIVNRSTDTAVWNKYGSYPSTGIMLTYLDLNTPILSKSYTAAYIFEPTFRLNNKMDFFIKTRIGLSYLTNPHDSLKNPTNNTYSTRFNFFTAAGLGITYKFNNHYSAVLDANFFHNSNGGFDQPNRGLNYPNLSAGIRYDVESNTTPTFRRIKDTSWKTDKWNYDAMAYYSPKEGYNYVWQHKRKYLFGAGFQTSYRISSLDALTLGTEIYYDDAIGSIKRNLGDNSSNVYTGLLMGNEFIFRKIIFSQQLGFFLHKNTESYTDIYKQPFGLVYHRWGLRYRLQKHWYFGFNFLVHGHVADFIDGRLIYRF
ncbi:acyloxyacyl hydrolase [Panacibacter ginsenosidivorans]|nr:acyloxyacyl hydrolase [Panacibacter ginsenosidivorans]